MLPIPLALALLNGPFLSGPTGIDGLEAAAMKSAVLSPSSYKPLIDRFNREDQDGTKLSIRNDQAWSFLEQNIPWFDCPDRQLEETYYYRWWSYRKHLTKTPDGWVVTEFLPPVPWAGIYNTIPCAAGHHLYEGRWLRNPQYMDDYARFWMLPEARPRNYSFWAADAVRAVTLATGDDRLANDLLSNLGANYQAWEKTHGTPSGLFTQDDGQDGMEYSLGGSGCRPSINSYLYGDAMAIAAIAGDCGNKALAKEFRAKAAEIQRLVETRLWNPKDAFFETVSPTTLQTCGIREEIGFTPWYFHLPAPSFDAAAWKQLLDPEGFAARFGPTTVERRATGFMHPENHDCLWNGPSWPYATTQTLVAMANLLDDYSQTVVSKQNYFDLLGQYSRSQQKNGRPWIAEDLDADTGKWIVDLPRSVCYNHSGFADLVITGLVGIRPREDDKLVVKPLLPAGAWDWFCLDALPYHGQSVTVLWDRDGRHYGHGVGLILFVNGKPAAHRVDLGELTAMLPPLPKAKPPVRWEKFAGGPVLGDSLGTCFDVCVLPETGKYRMYFSWRPKASIAVAESADGVRWGEPWQGQDGPATHRQDADATPRIVLGPVSTGWEDDTNRPSVVKAGGEYRMWYTGQAHGGSEIGYATSPDGLHWQRLAQPVLKPDQPWEKVAVMCPSVLWDEKAHGFRMWYSGGEQYEPDAIGYATSPDGVHWTKHDGPIFQADPANRWEQYKVTACQVLEWQGWHYMFYIGFRDIDHAQIGIARSRDGISHWERLPSNPIIGPTVDGWDADACYKPFAAYDAKAKRWLLWYNGRHGGLEQIGLATRPGPGLGF
ncbi:MAG TPA: glycosyl hydrolase family 65 protein [Fimbriimonadaceae bacterium]|nr:glycosyl hydrolase family 65 protein [Fimbriimonadaceae bacterium]